MPSQQKPARNGPEGSLMLRARGDSRRVLRLGRDHFPGCLEDGARTTGQAAKIRQVSTGKRAGTRKLPRVRLWWVVLGREHV